MLEGVERLANLTPSDGTRLALEAALVRGDAEALRAADGQFAAVARDGHTVRLARTIGVPLRYFVAKMYHGPYLVVSDRIDRLFDWCQEQRIGWQFDPAYTRMVPAHYVIELDQVGCPDPAPRYRRFFEPAIGDGAADPGTAGAAYIGAAYNSVKRWLSSLPEGAPIALAYSGGVDSTAVLLMARHALKAAGSNPDRVRAFTLDLGGGGDAVSAADTMRALGLASTLEVIRIRAEAIDFEEAIEVIEDYHPRDVECAAMGLCLLREIRARHPDIAYLLDGDGGDENLKSYPLEDSDLTLSSVLSNPLLYHEGWGVDAIKHSLTYSGGLSRGYVRSYAPARAANFQACSPFAERPAIAAALAIPFPDVVAGDPERLYAVKGEVVSRGIAALTGIDMPVQPKRRFQDGVGGWQAPPRLTKAWCRNHFMRQWQRRLEQTWTPERRSGNDMSHPTQVVALS